ncbi:MAG: flagellar motor protein MotB [Lachnospiraceae bacterium]
MKKRQKPQEGGASWMDTYGDMVTLLLCFFVLLYSISSVDQQKWEIIVKSMNPNAEATSQIVTDTATADGEGDVAGSMEKPEVTAETFDELYYTLKQAVEAQGLEGSVEVTKGEGYTFISFKNQVFFDGDSSTIKPQGKQVLDEFVNALGTANDAIQEVNVLGHTSQATPNEPNDVYTDRMLSAMRSVQVLIYMQQKNVISGEKLVQSSFGQYRPIASFETREERAKNRRVEIIITKNDAVQKSLSTYYDEIYGTTQ